jgi:L-2-hydroxyglutarate oxidase
MRKNYDIVVIGAGIIGLATAFELSKRYPKYTLAILEKEDTVATHQTGHNSGVIHSGIYYKPGSHKATLCASGSRALIDYSEKKGIEYNLIGKVVVATDEEEIPRLQTLYERGQANGVPGLKLINQSQLKEIEPHAYGIQALHSSKISDQLRRPACRCNSQENGTPIQYTYNPI